eukprot:TRINITY_DN3282_c0_g1_i1.p1 TRINITY_DN3282_c0_g1~~TRINITY_DN3282_c0_g1_i1.p1  ORF type:complete len:280 (+),score=38.93 TRINITY_DN3282_c0_g1_i1:53-892(+)
MTIFLYIFFFFFSSRRRHTRSCLVSWARRCVQETAVILSSLLISELFKQSQFLTTVFQRLLKGLDQVNNEIVLEKLFYSQHKRDKLLLRNAFPVIIFNNNQIKERVCIVLQELNIELKHTKAICELIKLRLATFVYGIDNSKSLFNGQIGLSLQVPPQSITKIECKKKNTALKANKYSNCLLYQELCQEGYQRIPLSEQKSVPDWIEISVFSNSISMQGIAPKLRRNQNLEYIIRIYSEAKVIRQLSIQINDEEDPEWQLDPKNIINQTLCIETDQQIE